MYKDLLARTPLLALPLFAMFVFIAVFFTVTLVTLTRKKRAYDAVAHLPLIEGQAPRAPQLLGSLRFAPRVSEDSSHE